MGMVWIIYGTAQYDILDIISIAETTLARALLPQTSEYFFQCKNRNRKVISTWAQHNTIAEMLLHIHFTPENFNILNTKFQLLILGRYYSLIKSVLDVMAEKFSFKVQL